MFLYEGVERGRVVEDMRMERGKWGMLYYILCCESQERSTFCNYLIILFFDDDSAGGHMQWKGGWLPVGGSVRE